MNITEITRLTKIAQKHVTDIVNLAIEHDSKKRMLVIFDTDTDLSTILSGAYKQAFVDATFIDFNAVEKEVVLDAFAGLAEQDLVVLVQSGDFRLNEFRIRLHLFERGIKVIDHRHLARNDESAHETYIEALSYDPEWYRGVGHAIKDKLAKTERLEIFCGEQKLIVEGGLEQPKPNLGDYRELKNVGGTFPIGEVFTEAKDLVKVNGSLMIYAFADVNFNIEMREPFRIDITDGLVTGWGENTPQAFVDVIEKIKTNERAIMREIGFGMNRAITRENYLKDITAFERILGLHVSLGEKHTVYKKEGIRAKKTRYHVDLFLDVTEVLADEGVLFKAGEYKI
mgnify:CR=1 FL=1